LRTSRYKTNQETTRERRQHLYLLKLSLVLATLSFAWLRFSDNTVDNDLWGHVLYGQRY